MTRTVRPLMWFWLVPYFAVGRVYARPWFGESAEFARRTNAQLALALILIWPLIFILPRTGWLADHPKAVGLLIVPALLFVRAWMKGEREQKYLALYRSMPRLRRIAFGLSTATLMVVPLVLVASSAPDKHKHQQQTEMTCDPAAAEVTAETCSMTVKDDDI
jgi:hypothetical protein